MKRFAFILAATVMFTAAMGNIAMPKAWISEIWFNGNGDWTLELGFYSYTSADIDSIRVESSAGSSIILSLVLIPGGGYPGFDTLAVITSLNLAAPLQVDPAADYLKVTSYVAGYGQVDHVAFGSYPGSFLDCRQPGESVSYLSYEYGPGVRRGFCIDSSPTIGAGNDTTGALGTYAGKVYDPSGNVFTGGFFELLPELQISIPIEPDGSFRERVFSRRYTFDTTNIWFPPWPWTLKRYTVQHTDFCLGPGALQTQDIITTSLLTDVGKHDQGSAERVVVSPNPFTDRVTFFLYATRKELPDDLRLLVFNQDGKQLARIPLAPGQARIDWEPGASVPPGVLIYRLEKNGQPVATGTLLKL